MQKKTMAKLLGRLMLVCGVVLLVFTVPGSLLVPTHALFKEAAQVTVSKDSPQVRDHEYVGWNGFTAKKMLLSAPVVLTYRLSTLSRLPTPARLYLRGGVDVQKEAELIADFGSRFDGLTMRVRVNGRESYSTSFDVRDLHYRTFSVELPRSGVAVVEVAFDPGPAGNSDYDWAVLRNLRVEPSFIEAYLLAGFLLAFGVVLVRSARPRPVAAKESRSVSLTSGRKLLFSVCIALVFGAVIFEAAFIKLARSSAITIRFPSLMPPGLTRYQASKEWRYDPEAGYSLLPNLDTEYEFEDGDIYYQNMTTLKRGKKPMSISHRTDQFGFRNSLPPQDARVAVVGDSFTMGLNSNHPFPGRMASLLGGPVYNLGTGGYGTLQEEISLRRMLASLSGVEVVVLAWFGGNDLWENHGFLLARHSGDMKDAYKNIVNTTVMTSVPARYYPLERRLSGRILLWLGAGMNTLADSLDLVVVKPPLSGHSDEEAPGNQGGRGPDDSSPAPFNKAEAKELNVFALNLESGRTVIAFFYPEGGLKMLAKSDLKNLENFDGMQEGLVSIARMRDMLAARDVDFLVCYLPGKFEVYRHLLGESYPGDELARRIISLSQVWNGETPQSLLARMDNNMDVQAKLLGDYCDSQGIPFFDLTPGFRAEASVKLLYYENDTHFNQAGHDLAAELIAGQINRLWPGRFPNPGN